MTRAMQYWQCYTIVITHVQKENTKVHTYTTQKLDQDDMYKQKQTRIKTEMSSTQLEWQQLGSPGN